MALVDELLFRHAPALAFHDGGANDGDELDGFILVALVGHFQHGRVILVRAGQGDFHGDGGLAVDIDGQHFDLRGGNGAGDYGLPCHNEYLPVFSPLMCYIVGRVGCDPTNGETYTGSSHMAAWLAPPGCNWKSEKG